MAHKVFIAALDCRRLANPDSHSCHLQFACQKLMILVAETVFNPCSYLAHSLVRATNLGAEWF